MYTHNARISVHQAKLMLILQMFNTSILILPRVAARQAGHDGYLLPIVAFFIGAIYIYTLSALTIRFSGETIVEFMPKIVTKPISVIICVLFAIKLIISSGLELRMFSEMISQVLLPRTPIEVIILIMLFAIAYLIKSGIEATGRMAEVLIYFVFIPLIVVLSLVVVKTDYKQVMPFFTAQPVEALKGAYYTSLTFLPLEFLLMLGAMLKKPKKIKRIAFWAIGIIAVIETIVIVLTFTGVGVIETTRQIWPVITLMENIQLPGSFVENQEILMMSWWVLSIYMYVGGGIYFASQIFSELMHFERENVTVLPLLPVVFLVAIFPGSLVESYKYFIAFQGKYGIWFLFIIPLFLLLIAKVRRVRGDGYEK